MPTQADQFKQMLQTDARNYALLVQYRALIGEMERDAVARQDSAQLRKAAGHLRTWGQLQQAYHYRQADYRTNTTYKVSQWLTDAADATTQTVKRWWDRLTAGLRGLGVLPALSVPVLIAASAVLSVAVVAYFVSRYYSQTTLDYDKLTDKVAEIAKTDPALAKQILEQAGAIQSTQSETSLQELAQGAKWAVAAGGAYVLYRLAVQHKIIKPLSLGARRR